MSNTAAQKASDRAYAALRADIIDGTLLPGCVLAEVEQSTRLGVSRTPLREALARLTADALVAPQSGRGLVVTDVSSDNIRELFEVRQALEEQAARLASQRGNIEIFRELEKEFLDVTNLIDDGDPARHGYYSLVARFDDALDDAVGNGYLVTALRNLRTHLVRVRRFATDNPSRLTAAAAEHLLIVQAIIARDADLAAHATHVHLHRALQGALASSRRAAAVRPSPSS
ncbi:MAG: GntR family transcriptional regulator [Microbacteriaceae bacterium]